MLLQMGSRPTDNDTSVVTGGDISRYQRTTIPLKRKVTVSRDMMGGGSQAPMQSAPQSAPAAAPAAPKGPVVRVVRNGTVTEVPVGR
jgi:pilus assembly protein CpaB